MHVAVFGHRVPLALYISDLALTWHDGQCHVHREVACHWKSAHDGYLALALNEQGLQYGKLEMHRLSE